MESLIPKRKKTKKIWVGDVAVGGDAPISVQSMTNTETTDVEATVKQINDLEEASSRSFICFTVASTSVVSVFVIDCTEIGASPPTATSPTQIFFVFFLFGIRDSTLTFNQQFLNHQKSMLFL